MAAEVIQAAKAIEPVAIPVIEDCIVSAAQHLFNLINKHLPDHEVKPTALHNVKFVVQLVQEVLNHAKASNDAQQV